MNNFVPNIYEFISEGKMQIMNQPDLIKLCDQVSEKVLFEIRNNYTSSNSIQSDTDSNEEEDIEYGDIDIHSIDDGVMIDGERWKYDFNLTSKYYKETDYGVHGVFLENSSSKEYKEIYIRIFLSSIADDYIDDNDTDLLNKIKAIVYHEASHSITYIFGKYDSDYSDAQKSSMYNKYSFDIDKKNKKIENEYKTSLARYEKYYDDIKSGNKKFDILNKPTKPTLSLIKKSSFDDFSKNKKRNNTYFRSNGTIDSKELSTDWKEYSDTLNYIIYKYWNKDEMESFKTKSLLSSIKDDLNDVNRHINTIKELETVPFILPSKFDTIDDDETREYMSEEYYTFNSIKKNLISIIYPRFKNKNLLFIKKFFLMKSLKKIEKYKNNLLRNFYEINKEKGNEYVHRMSQKE